MIAGDPAMDGHAILLRFAVRKAEPSSSVACVSRATLAMIDKIVTVRRDR